MKIIETTQPLIIHTLWLKQNQTDNKSSRIFLYIYIFSNSFQHVLQNSTKSAKPGL